MSHPLPSKQGRLAKTELVLGFGLGHLAWVLVLCFGLGLDLLNLTPACGECSGARQQKCSHFVLDIVGAFGDIRRSRSVGGKLCPAVKTAGLCCMDRRREPGSLISGAIGSCLLTVQGPTRAAAFPFTASRAGTRDTRPYADPYPACQPSNGGKPRFATAPDSSCRTRCKTPTLVRHVRHRRAWRATPAPN